MDRPSRLPRRLVVSTFVLLLVIAAVPGTALAAPVQGVGGTLVVEAGETVDGVQGVAGTVVIRGTVTGDVEVAAGTLVVAGEVQGDVSGAAGTVDIRGRVGGDVNVGTGSLTVAEGAVIEGQLNAGAGSARIAGTVVGDAAIGTGTLVLEPTATFQGDLRYDGDLEDRGATVEGRLIRDESLAGVTFEPFRGVGDIVLDIYGFLVTLVLGVVLLAAFPAGSRRLADRAVASPLETGLYGLAALIGVPVLLLVIALTIIGIPLAIAGALLFALVAWVGSVYGRYAVGTWLLGYTDTDNRWAALVVGMLAVAIVGLVPLLGGLVEFLVLLLGLGGLAKATLDRYERRRGTAAEPAAPT